MVERFWGDGPACTEAQRLGSGPIAAYFNHISPKTLSHRVGSSTPAPIHTQSPRPKLVPTLAARSRLVLRRHTRQFGAKASLSEHNFPDAMAADLGAQHATGIRADASPGVLAMQEASQTRRAPVSLANIIILWSRCNANRNRPPPAAARAHRDGIVLIASYSIAQTFGMSHPARPPSRPIVQNGKSTPWVATCGSFHVRMETATVSNRHVGTVCNQCRPPQPFSCFALFIFRRAHAADRRAIQPCYRASHASPHLTTCGPNRSRSG